METRIVHVSSNLKREGVVGLIPLPPLGQLGVAVASELGPALLAQAAVLGRRPVQTCTATRVALQPAREAHLDRRCSAEAA